MSQKSIILWFRQDLRLVDHPALHFCLSLNRPIIPLFILDTHYARPLGGASKWWLHQSLKTLNLDIEAMGGKLLLAKGGPHTILRQLIKEHRVDTVVWHRAYEPEVIQRDGMIKKSLKEDGVDCHSFNGRLLREPFEMETKSKTPYKVFTPFWKALREGLQDMQPLEKPHIIPFGGKDIDGIRLEDLDLHPHDPDWSKGLHETWDVGERAAHAQLDKFLDTVENYPTNRDRPDLDTTSHLSPYLYWGQLSPRQVIHRLWAHQTMHPNSATGCETLARELGWRDFFYHQLYHFPKLTKEPVNPLFSNLPWQNDPDNFEAWCKGLTGYPYLDAGMRQLWYTGWMHGRVRMAVASFLIKHLQIDWREGEAWFWDTLVDADMASNCSNWQWVAGSGADAAPYFRIFNPILQSQKFDPGGDYIRRWVPELRDCPTAFIHEPWKAPPSVRSAFGAGYPSPIISHEIGRRRALEVYAALKSTH